MASNVRKNFQSKSTPANTPTAGIDHAMSALNEALEDLGRLRVRNAATNVVIDLTLADKKACIEAFILQISNMIVPDLPVIPFDINLFRSLPDIIDSPYVNIDPGMRVMYYNALYFGIFDVRGPEDTVA